MAKFYSNENFPLPVVLELRRLGHDVLTSLDAGRANRAISDEEVLTFAISEGRCLLSLNRRHFFNLAKRFPQHTGMVLCTFDPDFVGQAGRINEALSAQVPLEGQIIRVNRPPA